MPRKKDYHRTKEYVNPLKTKKQKKKRKRKLNKAIWVPLMVVIIIAIICVILVSPIFIINKVEVGSNVRADIAELIYTSLEKSKDQVILGFIPNNHIFWFKVDEVVTSIEDPYIKEIILTKKIPNILHLKIVERLPQAVYLFEGSQYFLDSSGKIIEPLINKGVGKSGIILPHIISTSTPDILSNINEQKVKFIKFFYDEFPRYLKDINLLTFEMRQGSSDAKILTSALWYIQVDTLGDTRVQLSNLKRTYLEKITTQEKNNLEYIDVRIPSFVYYK